MNKSFGNDDAALAAYVLSLYEPEDQVLREIRERSQRDGLPDIQLAALDARHLEIMARMCRTRRAVEVGTLGGYSGVSLLRGMEEDGVLDTIEVNAKHAEVARESFRRAGFKRRARVHVGLASEVLPNLTERGPFDLCFIDADKEGYPSYLAWAADNLRVGGAVILDNAFLFGRLADKDIPPGERELLALRQTHTMLACSGWFRATVLPTGEGLAVGIKLQLGSAIR
jgi:caffeoyl-CoA O-methyltransferase